MDDKQVEREIEDLLKNLVDRDDSGDVKPTAKKNLHAKTLVGILEQYLSPFILFGYDVHGEAVAVSKVNTQQELDALHMSVGRYVTYQASNNYSDTVGDYNDDQHEG
jgi:hypothetical protein